MNLSLTLNFDTVQELQQFLTNRTPGAAAKIADPVPTPTPTPAKFEGTLVEIAPADPVPVEVDATALKGALMARLKLLANTMDDPAVLGKFINSFGVSRFSELPDDQLVSFKAALEAEFGDE